MKRERADQFAQAALGSITDHRAPYSFAHGVPVAVMRETVWPHGEVQQLVPRPVPLPHDRVEVAAGPQAFATMTAGHGCRSGGESGGDYAVRRLRPLRRRAAMMARPLRVDIRARKPCLRFLGIRFGCHVRFGTVSPLFAH